MIGFAATNLYVDVALDRVIDPYQVSEDKRRGVRADPNRLTGIHRTTEYRRSLPNSVLTARNR